jgi:putative FmdB family regulatory protein
VPIYGYRCTSCGHEFEIHQKVSAEPLTVCPQCQGKLQKMLYPTGVIFKGSGFYSTDYKGSGKAASSNGSPPPSESKSESKPESKPDSSD